MAVKTHKAQWTSSILSTLLHERGCVQKTFIYTEGWSVEFFFIGQNRSSNQRSGSGMILKVQIQSSGARASVGAQASKFLYSKKSRGLKYQYFFLKIRMWLPFGFKFFIEFSIYR